MKIRPVEAKMFYADSQIDRLTDRWTDSHDGSNRCFSQFVRVNKKCGCIKFITEILQYSRFVQQLHIPAIWNIQGK